MFLDRVDVVATYDEQVHSPSTSIKIPSVIALKEYVLPQQKAPFTRFNLYLRDDFCCQYCGSEGMIRNFRDGVKLTLDHVFPKSRGGHLNWLNTVAACADCNVKKSNKTPEEARMALKRKPYTPSQRQLVDKARQFPIHSLHETWRQFLQLDESW